MIKKLFSFFASAILVICSFAQTEKQNSFASDTTLQHLQSSPDFLSSKKLLEQYGIRNFLLVPNGKIISTDILRSLSNNRVNIQMTNSSLLNNLFSSGNFHLVKDINPIAESIPYNNNYNNYFDQKFAVLNGVAYFNADDGIHGRQLWRSNGKSGGTYMVKEFNSIGGYPPNQIVTANGKIFFLAGTAGQIWESDGTEAGTFLLKQFPNDYIFTLYSSGNRVYFVVNINGSTSNQLWESDGTIEGTQSVFDCRTYNGYGISHLQSVNNLLYYTVYTSANGRELWRSDGTFEGTFQVKDINPNNYDDQGPDRLTAFNNRLYFTADDGSGRKLWATDINGTTAMLVQQNSILLQNASGYYAYENTPMATCGNRIYFSGYSIEKGYELYCYDETNNVSLVKDISPGSASTVFNDYTDAVNVNNILYFIIKNEQGESELWKTTGIESSTALVKSFSGAASIDMLFGDNGTLIFNCYDPNYGKELWRSDGTAMGTFMVKDIYKGIGSSNAAYFTRLNGKTIFTAYSKLQGDELWITDGTESGTVLAKDINTTATANSSAGSNYRGIAALPFGQVAFSASNKQFGNELYISGGTDASTRVIDIAPGEESSVPVNFTSKNGLVYFTTAFTNKIYKTDGTKAGTIKIVENNDCFIQNYTVAESGVVYYIKYSFTSGNYELWRSDGTQTGTYLLTNKATYSSYIVMAGENGYFAAGDATTGFELWKTDGTVSGTKLVKDINPGSNGSNPYTLMEYNGNIFFGANDGINTALWKSNGTAAGTMKVKNVSPVMTNDYNGALEYYTVSNNTLFFVGSNANVGTELWKTDGTLTGTKVVKDILRGGNSSYPSSLVNVNGTVFFKANNGESSAQLWKTTGTATGTKIVKVITESGNEKLLNNLTCAVGRLFFCTDDSLWISDGTSAGTKTINDQGLSGVTGFQNLTTSFTKLFFGGYTSKFGSELYEGDALLYTILNVLNESSNKLQNLTSDFTARIYPNPARTASVLELNKTSGEVTVVITDLNGKLMWRNTISGKSNINLPVNKLSSGVYIVSILNGTQKVNLKLVKE